MTEQTADEVRRHLREKYGWLCIECGVPWHIPSPACPHQEYDVHPTWRDAPSASESAARWADAMYDATKAIRNGIKRPDAEPPAIYLVTTICGSMRYYPEMVRVAGILTERGQIVLMPHAVAPTTSSLKRMLDDMHKRKIDMSSSITVVGVHQGESTNGEIEYARSKGKRIYAWTEHFGQCNY